MHSHAASRARGKLISADHKNAHDILTILKRVEVAEELVMHKKGRDQNSGIPMIHSSNPQPKPMCNSPVSVRPQLAAWNKSSVSPIIAKRYMFLERVPRETPCLGLPDTQLERR
jgi:hypothetical protein